MSTGELELHMTSLTTLTWIEKVSMQNVPQSIPAHYQLFNDISEAANSYGIIGTFSFLQNKGHILHIYNQSFSWIYRNWRLLEIPNWRDRNALHRNILPRMYDRLNQDMEIGIKNETCWKMWDWNWVTYSSHRPNHNASKPKNVSSDRKF